MRRHLSLLLITLLLTALSACGNRSEPPEPKAIPTVTGLPAQPQVPQKDSESYPAPEEDSGEASTETGEADRNVAPAEAYPAPPPQPPAGTYPDPTEALPPTPYPEPSEE